MNDFTYSGSELELFANAHKWKRYWAKQVRPYLGQRVFDVGAGLGENFKLLWQPDASWICIDPDEALAAKIHKTASEMPEPRKCNILHGQLATLSSDEMADTILYIDVLEHIKDDRAELEQAFMHLKAGGYLVVLAPAYQWLFSPFDEAVGHFRRYNAKTLRSIAPNGLTLKKLHYLDSAGLFASAANKLILKSSTPTHSQIAFWDRALIPLSRLLDKLIAHRAGKSILAVWQKPYN